MILGLGPFFSARASSDTTILTLNIHCFADNWKHRLFHIMTKVVELSPDIIALQEVCSDNRWQDQREYIKQFLLSKNFPILTFESQFTHRAWDKYGEYLLIIAKNKSTKIDKGILPASPLARGYLGIEVNNTWYITTHLEHRADYWPFREKQIQFLIRKFSARPHVLFGDFNSSPSTFEQSSLWHNGYYPQFPGDTHNGNDGNHMRNIDGFWLSSELAQHLSSFSASIELNYKIDGRYLSDHFAVLLHLLN